MIAKHNLANLHAYILQLYLFLLVYIGIVTCHYINVN